MPISAPLTLAATIFRRSVGTPAHSAASSSSRIAARPRPIVEVSITRATTSANAAISTIAPKRMWI